jgi:hypothetical protein
VPGLIPPVSRWTTFLPEASFFQSSERTQTFLTALTK